MWKAQRNPGSFLSVTEWQTPAARLGGGGCCCSQLPAINTCMHVERELSLEASRPTDQPRGPAVIARGPGQARSPSQASRCPALIPSAGNRRDKVALSHLHVASPYFMHCLSISVTSSSLLPSRSSADLSHSSTTLPSDFDVWELFSNTNGVTKFVERC